MKDKITMTKKDGQLFFYLVTDVGRAFLFTQRFTKGVHDFFINDKSEAEIKGFRKWRKNPRLSKTIEKIPIYAAYARKELLQEY